VYAGVRKDVDAENIKALHLSNLLPLHIDTTDQSSMDAAVAFLHSTSLPIIGLINNAGVSTNSPIEFLPMAKLRQLLETNVVGPTYLTQQLIPSLRASQGRVVQISSVLGKVTLATRGAYCASKHAFEALSDVLRLELAGPFGVSVSVVEPAYVRTEIFGKIQQEIETLLSPELRSLYGPFFYREDQAARKKAQIAKGDSPVVTSTAIEHALFADYPKTRYVVANFAGVRADLCLFIAWMLPDRLADLLKGMM
jgi:NAD(P)-dependent dehydrogenase (short-subunit alcohol dehydrogenase family)